MMPVVERDKNFYSEKQFNEEILSPSTTIFCT